MTTKERIVDEALTIFSIKGFKGTSVKNIADAVGIKDSSLYKHFKSKQEILDTIVITIGKHIETMSEKMGIPVDNNLEQAVAVYSKFDENDLVNFSKTIFLFYLNDSFISRFWRMGNIEQYNNPQIYQMFSKLFLEDSIVYQTTLFSEMIKHDVFINADPQVMAMNFYTPVFFLLSKYSNTNNKEDEALAMLDKQIREFYRIYTKKQEGK